VGDRADLERELTAELKRQSAGSVPIWNEANAARERGDHQRASALYSMVARKAPKFSAATRRQAGEELALGNRGKAITLGRSAVAAEASATNLAALAVCLSAPSNGKDPVRKDVEEALTLVSRAATLAPDDTWVQTALCQVALQAEDVDALGRGVGRLLALAPEESSTHQFAAVHALFQGSPQKARAALSRARELGMPERSYQALSDVIDESEGVLSRWLPTFGWVLGLWVGTLLLLLGVGALLSRSVLAEAETLSRSSRTPAGEGSGLLRALYRFVLWASCGYYYLSLPLVAALVVLLGGGIVYAMLAAGRIPIKLLLVVVVLTLATLWSILKGLLVRGRDDDPGQRLSLQREPRLRRLLHDVAGRVGTRAVDNVYLTPGTDLAVLERGGLGRQLRHATERCLILGVGILDGLKIGPLKAVLAHEYGHFSNRDTAGGGFALAVRRSLAMTAQSLAEGGAAAWYNPAWLFLNGFFRVFLIISHGASRLQEILADRWAALTYGSKAFEEGLRHVVERSVRFDVHANLTIQEMAGRQAAVANLYSHAPSTTVSEQELSRAIRGALSQPSSVYDTHPSPMERTRWVRALGAKGTPTPEDAEDAWSLFSSREALETQMTEAVRLALR